MSLFQRICGLILVLLLARGATAATPLNNLVSDRAAVILSFHDVPGMVTEWNKSPWVKTWNDEQVKRYFAPLRAQWKVDDWDNQVKTKTGYSISDLLSFATGDAILVLPDFDFTDSASGKVPPLLIGIDIGDNAAKIEALFSKSVKDEKATEETTDFSGVSVHIIHPAAKDSDKLAPPTVWALVEGKWLLSPSKEAVLAAIDGVHNGGVENAWGRSERWVRLQKRTGDTHVIGVINVESIYPWLKTSLETRLKAEGAQAGPFATDGQTVLTSLGLDTWREIYFTAKLGDDSADLHAGLTYSEARGLTKLLAYHDGPVPTPDFISSRWLSVATSKISLKESYAALEEVLEAFSPALSGLAQGQVRAFNKRIGIDVKRDLFGSLGDTVIIARSSSPTADKDAAAVSDLDQFFAVSLQNPDTFSTALEAFRRLLGPDADTWFKTRDFLGQKITTFEAGNNGGPRATKALHYAVAKGYFFLSVGSAAPVEAALRGGGDSKDSLWSKPDVVAALAQVPANASSFQYENINELVGSVFKSVANASALLNHANAPQPVPENSESNADTPPVPLAPPTGLAVDVSAPPDIEAIAKYWGYGWSYLVRDSSGVHTTSQIVYPK